MKKLIRKLLFWALKKNIRSYAVSKIISDIDMMHPDRESEIVAYTMKDMASQIGMELLKDGAIEIEEDDWDRFNGRRYIMRVCCVNFKHKKK